MNQLFNYNGVCRTDSATPGLCDFDEVLAEIVLHPAVDLKSKDTVSFCAIWVGCIESSAHPVADHHTAESCSSEESVAAALWE